MYAGQIVETGPRDAIVEHPLHPYTRALIAAVERMDESGQERLEAIPGDPPDLRVLQPGCPFAARCPSVMERCRTIAPTLTEQAAGQQVACHLYPAATEEQAA
jgi:oligopeptide/dipeptide ABC transporter ATP-binding protein